MNQNVIVVHDPDGTYPAGTLLDGKTGAVAAKHKVVVLPADPNRINTAFGGFFYRPWGWGWQFDRMIASRGCPMLVGTDPAYTWMYWAAACVPIRKGEPMHGQIRLTTDGSAGAISGGLALDQLPPKFELIEYPIGAEHHGFIISGRCQMSVSMAGQIGLSLWGVARNVGVLWSAVSISTDKVEITDAVPY